MSRPIVITLLAATLSACSTGEAHSTSDAPIAGASTPNTAPTTSTASTNTSPSVAPVDRTPNELGRIPVLEYHLIEQREWRWGRNYDRFRKDLQTMYDNGYRPVTMQQVLDKKINLPKGISPVVFVFDDASPGQFSYIEQDGKLEITPNSAMGIWLDFNHKHSDWTNSAVFCVLPAAAAGHAFFGEKGIDGQKTAWRFRKLQFLAQNGFEICNHTLWHANLGKYPDSIVQEQIARGQLAIDSALPNYKVRTFALPLGVWPKNKPLAWQGSWTDPKSKKSLQYKYDAVLEVAGGPTRSPYDSQFDPHHIRRVELFGNALEQTIKDLDRSGPNGRYVSDGNPTTIAKP